MTVPQKKFPFRLTDYKLGKKDGSPMLLLKWEVVNHWEVFRQYGDKPPREIGTSCRFGIVRDREDQSLLFIITLADWPPMDPNKVLFERITGEVRAHLRSWLKLVLHRRHYKCQEIVQFTFWGGGVKEIPINIQHVPVAPFTKHFNSSSPFWRPNPHSVRGYP